MLGCMNGEYSFLVRVICNPHDDKFYSVSATCLSTAQFADGFIRSDFSMSVFEELWKFLY